MSLARVCHTVLNRSNMSLSTGIMSLHSKVFELTVSVFISMRCGVCVCVCVQTLTSMCVCESVRICVCESVCASVCASECTCLCVRLSVRLV
jgi:hypothetical protein